VKVALVLGAGGVVGGAFHAGVLAALEEALGFDARSADLVVGTSAGSLTGAFLRAEMSPRDLMARALGAELSAEGGKLLAQLGAPPAPPRLRFDWRDLGRPAASPRALRFAALRPWGVRASALVAAALPSGRVPSEPLARFLAPLFPRGWPSRPFWTCAVRLRDARRVVFGRDEVPGASIGHAVAASCAIPGVFAPVRIEGERYVDGGAHSPSNLDLVADLDVELVLVSSPMSAAGSRVRFSLDAPIRRLLRAQLAREAARLRRRGIPVVAFQPTPEDQRAMGLDAMDPSRRAAVAAQARASTLRRLERADVRARLAPLRR
jgi:NTE family protein